MLCENAYYLTSDDKSKLGCNNSQKLAEDDFFGEQCPFIYYCTI